MMMDWIELRNLHESDLPIFFGQQQDPDARHMAAFTPKEPADEAAFMMHWRRIMAEDGVTIRTILYRGRVAGHVLSFTQLGNLEVSYWLGKEFWGRGIATAALRAFLDHVPTRPLYARAAKDNVASIRVLQKCGFTICGEDRGFANARDQEIEEYVLQLE